MEVSVEVLANVKRWLEAKLSTLGELKVYEGLVSSLSLSFRRQ